MWQRRSYCSWILVVGMGPSGGFRCLVWGMERYDELLTTPADDHREQLFNRSAEQKHHRRVQQGLQRVATPRRT